jgi:hypothetical protein
MNIIYHCFGGSHSSVTAAALHLKFLSRSRIPSTDELMELPYYDKTTDADFGTMRYMGTDEFGNDVYVLGKKSLANRFSNLLQGIAQIVGAEDQLLMVDCMAHINWSMKLGGFTSRRLRLVSVGRPVVTWGTRKEFAHLINLVETVRLRVMNAKPANIEKAT